MWAKGVRLLRLAIGGQDVAAVPFMLLERRINPGARVPLCVHN